MRLPVREQADIASATRLVKNITKRRCQDSTERQVDFSGSLRFLNERNYESPASLARPSVRSYSIFLENSSIPIRPARNAYGDPRCWEPHCGDWRKTA